MIVSKTPIRLTLFGGGTDYPIFFKKYGGETLGFAINRYSYLTIKENNLQNKYKYFLSYKNIEKKNEIKKISHPSIRETLKFMNIKEGIEIHYTGDIPAKTGLGSSSSFTVGLLKCLYAHKKKKISNLDIAKKAIFIEQKMIKENVGCQDQLTTSIGGILNVKYFKSHFVVNKLNLDKTNLLEFENSIILFFTGIERYASRSLNEQLSNIAKGYNIPQLLKMKEQAKLATKMFKKKINIRLLGEMLNENWNLKKELSNNVTNKIINQIYDDAIACGAYGGKLVGAGAGGFLMFVCKNNIKSILKKKFYKLKNLEIKVDHLGSNLILK